MLKKIILISIFFLIYINNISSQSDEKELYLEAIELFNSEEFSKSYLKFNELNSLLGRYTARLTPYLVMSKWNESQIQNKRIKLTDIYPHVKALEHFDLSDSIHRDELDVIIDHVNYAYKQMMIVIPNYIMKNDRSFFTYDDLWSKELKGKTSIDSVFYRYIDLSWFISRVHWGLSYSTRDYSGLTDENINAIKEGLNFHIDDNEYKYGFQNFQNKIIGDDVFNELIKNINTMSNVNIKNMSNNIIQLQNDGEFIFWSNKYLESFSNDTYFVDFKSERDKYLKELEEAKIAEAKLEDERKIKRLEKQIQEEQKERNKKIGIYTAINLPALFPLGVSMYAYSEDWPEMGFPMIILAGLYTFLMNYLVIPEML